MRLIRASEIGEYSFCRRAWWLHAVRGLAPGNAAGRLRGAAAHRRHGALVTAAGALRLAALLLLLAAAALWLWGR